MVKNALLVIALVVALSGLLTILGGTRLVHADEPLSTSVSPTSPIMAELGRPAHRQRVEAFVHRSLSTGTPDPALLAETLGHAGGRAALEGLSVLLDHRDSATRMAALRALVQVDLRSRRVARVVSRIARESKGTEQAAAVRALGVVGSGEDVPVMLLLSEAEDAGLGRAAFQALRTLTGLRIPPVRARWIWQWRVLQRRAERSLPDQLDMLDLDPEQPGAEALVREVGRNAWIDLALADDYIGPWLRSPSPTKRRYACRLCADLRLSEHASAVEAAGLYTHDRRLRSEATRTLELLGHIPRGPLGRASR